MISPSNYILVIIGLVYPCIQIPGMILQVKKVYPSIPATQQGRPSFSETRCTGVDFWWFPVSFFGPRNQQKPTVQKGAIQKIWVKFCSRPQPLRAWSFLTQFLRHPLFANGLRRVEWSWTVEPFIDTASTWRWHGIHRGRFPLPRRLSRLSEQALGYGIFALLLCPRSRKKNIGHGHLGTAVMVSHLVNIGSQLRSYGCPYSLSSGEIRANTFKI